MYCMSNYMYVHSLEVSLEKQRDDTTWPRLREEEAEEGVWEEGAGLPQRGQVTGQQELEELQRKIAEATKSEVWLECCGASLVNMHS